MRATIAWSYQLLAPQEQRLFRSLSVFVGGCDLSALETMAKSTGLEASHILDGVSVLLENHLLLLVEQPNREPRLMVLETIREYGLECLQTSGQEAAAQQAHAHYYLALAEEAEPHLAGPEQVQWLDRLDREQENLRAVLQRATIGGDEEVDHALRLGTALAWFWYMRGQASEGRGWLEWVQAERPGSTAVRARALHQAAMMADWLDEYELSQALSSESLALSRESGHAPSKAWALFWLGSAARARSEYATARALFKEALVLFRQLGDQHGKSLALAGLARVIIYQGDFPRVRELAEESYSLAKLLGDKVVMLDALIRLARCFYLSQIDPARACALAEEILALAREGGFMQYIAYALSLLGLFALTRGEEDTARSHLEEALRLHTELSHSWGIALGIYDLAGLSLIQGDYATARASYEACLQRSNAIGDKEMLASCLEGLAAAMVAQGGAEGPVSESFWAAQLWGAAARLREAIDAPMPPVRRAAYEQALAAAQTQMGDQVFAAAWAQGLSMTPEQALAAQGKALLSTPLPTRPASAPPKKSTSSPAGLTAREVEVLRLLTQGLTNPQMAERLVVSLPTVNTHVASIFNKLGVTSRAAATRYAVEHHLV